MRPRIKFIQKNMCVHLLTAFRCALHFTYKRWSDFYAALFAGKYLLRMTAGEVVEDREEFWYDLGWFLKERAEAVYRLNFGWDCQTLNG